MRVDEELVTYETRHRIRFGLVLFTESIPSLRIGASITVVICRFSLGEPGAVRPRILRQPVRGLTAPGSPNSDSH